MKKTLPKIQAVVLLLFASFTAFAQDFSAIYNFNNVTSTSGRVDPTPPPTAAGVNFGAFTAASTLSANANASSRFSFTNWSTGATNSSDAFSGSIDLTRYYEVTLEPQPNYSVRLDSIIFTLQRSGTGIRQYAVRSSVDGYTTNLPASINPANANLQVVAGNVFQVSDASTTAENGSRILLGSAFSNITSPVTFRFYGWNAESTAGTFSIDNVQFSGTATLAASAPSIILSTSSLSFAPTAVGSSSTSSYTLRGENLTSGITITTAAPYSLSLTQNGTYTTSLTVPAAELATDKTIFVRFSPTSNGSFPQTITHTSTNANTRTINVNGDGFDPANLIFNFDNCLASGSPGSGFTAFSVAGPQVWSCTNFGRNGTKGVEMNGFSAGSTIDNEDWLISPSLMISSINLPILRFWSKGEFNGPSLQLLISTNYDGTSNPNSATWTELEGNFPPATNTWSLSDGIDLTAYKNASKVYIAFKYTSSVELGSARWTIDDVDITNRTTLLAANPSLLNFAEVSVGTSSPGVPFIVKAIGYGAITLTAPSQYQLSLDSTTYSNSLTISQTAAEAGIRLFARLTPTTKALKIEGTIRFTGTGLDSNRIILTGTSFPRAETFDVGAYNLSFFGSNPTNNPTPQKIATQVNNIAIVFNRLKLDVTGLSEVSNDAAMDSLVRKVPHSRAILSNRWSVSFAAPDPSFPPQKVGFLFDTTTMKLISARAMFTGLYDSARTGFPEKLPNYPGGSPSGFWASGRLPYMATFDATINGVTKRVIVVVIHAKSATDATSYNRRVYDARVLKDSLDAYYKNENLLIVGDYNDRLTTSTYGGNPNSPYKPFVDDANYAALTLPLDQAGRSSFIGGTSLIDHIISSSTLASSYIANSTEIEDPRSYISGYNATTGSDHLPVYSRFSFGSALPVTLTNFSAEPKSKAVLVSWVTASEFNSQHFVVERSSNGRTFTGINTTLSRGNNNTTIQYQFLDESPLNGISYYRLKQVDKDGKSAHSKVVAVNFAEDKNIMSVYPNPVTDRVQLTSSLSTSVVTLSLIGTEGVILMQAKGSISEVNRQLNLKLPSLSKGVYTLKVVTNNNENQVIRLVKQ